MILDWCLKMAYAVIMRYRYIRITRYVLAHCGVVCISCIYSWPRRPKCHQLITCHDVDEIFFRGDRFVIGRVNREASEYRRTKNTYTAAPQKINTERKGKTKKISRRSSTTVSAVRRTKPITVIETTRIWYRRPVDRRVAKHDYCAAVAEKVSRTPIMHVRRVLADCTNGCGSRALPCVNDRLRRRRRLWRRRRPGNLYIGVSATPTSVNVDRHHPPGCCSRHPLRCPRHAVRRPSRTYSPNHPI